MKRTVVGDMGTGGAPSVGAVYTDSATVKRVQKALNLTADGIIGPKTKAAVKAFNVQRGQPGDGENITDGVLAAVSGLEYLASQPKPSAAPMMSSFSPSGALIAPGQPSYSPEAPSAFSLIMTENVQYINQPLWKVLVGIVGVTAIGIGFAKWRSR